MSTHHPPHYTVLTASQLYDLSVFHYSFQVLPLYPKIPISNKCLTLTKTANNALYSPRRVNVVHMLETADKRTAPALEELFKKTIFDTRIMKMWWNLQSDFFVLHNTIAYMYQGTAREPSWCEAHPMQRLRPRTVTPNSGSSAPTSMANDWMTCNFLTATENATSTIQAPTS